jgi:hypothetical protein
MRVGTCRIGKKWREYGLFMMSDKPSEDRRGFIRMLSQLTVLHLNIYSDNKFSSRRNHQGRSFLIFHLFLSSILQKAELQCTLPGDLVRFLYTHYNNWTWMTTNVVVHNHKPQKITVETNTVMKTRRRCISIKTQTGDHHSRKILVRGCQVTRSSKVNIPISKTCTNFLPIN